MGKVKIATWTFYFGEEDDECEKGWSSNAVNYSYSNKTRLPIGEKIHETYKLKLKRIYNVFL